MAEYVVIAQECDIADGEPFAVDFEGERVLVARVDGNWFAIGGICTHEYAHLDEGDLFDYEIICPKHFASFDVRTGEVLGPPAESPVPVFEVIVVNGKVLISRQPVHK